MTVYAITDTKNGEQGLRLLIFKLPEFRGNCSATSSNMKLVHWPLMGGLLHLVQQGGALAGP